MKRGELFIITAPSGAGKTSIVKAITDILPQIKKSVSFTTRPMRPGETEGVDYHFIDTATFLSMKRKGDFLEYAEVFGNYYGTSRSWLQEQLNKGNDVILEIDWQGAQQVRRAFPDCTSIFILPPSREILLERLRARGQDSENVISRRTLEAVTEMSHYHEFDYTIINDVFETAVEEVKAVMISIHVETSNQEQVHTQLIKELLE